MTVVRSLEARVRSNGAAPLLTFYDLDTGERTELSGRTFANWVDKAANLLAALDVEGVVAVPLLAARPGHWLGLVGAAAAWQAGLAVTAAGAGFTLDAFALEVQAQPDSHFAVAGGAEEWVEGDARCSVADGVEGTQDRVLVRPGDPLPTLRAALIAPLLGGGSSVVVAGSATSERLARIADQERCRNSA